MCLFVCVFVCLFLCLFVCLLVCLFACLFLVFGFWSLGMRKRRNKQTSNQAQRQINNETTKQLTSTQTKRGEDCLEFFRLLFVFVHLHFFLCSFLRLSVRFFVCLFACSLAFLLREAGEMEFVRGRLLWGRAACCFVLLVLFCFVCWLVCLLVWLTDCLLG